MSSHWVLGIMLFITTWSVNAEIVRDRLIAGKEPRNFRVLLESNEEVLKVIGSGEFSQKWFEEQYAALPKPLLVVDLRQEPHGFVRGLPYSVYTGQNIENIYLPKELITLKEKLWLNDLKRHRLRKEVFSEQHLVESKGAEYLRFPIRDHYPPSYDEMKALMTLLKTKYKNHWIYFHCRAGLGRTTFLMSLMDIMENYSKDTLQDILERQHKIGGSDYIYFYPKDHYKYPLKVWRYQLLKRFYQEQTRSI